MSKGLNLVQLIGHIGQDLEKKYTPDGVLVVRISLATSDKTKKDGEWVERTEWHSIVLFGKIGEIAADFLHKGSRIYIAGSLRTRNWDDDKGQKHYKTEIVANNLVMLDTSGNDTEKKNSAYKGKGQALGPAGTQNNETEEDDDLPF